MADRHAALRKKVEAYYKVQGLPITEDLGRLVASSIELGLSDDDVLENLAASAKKAPEHLRAGAEILLLRKIGWVHALLTEIVEDGYVAQWVDEDGETCHKVVSFDNSNSIKPRTWDPTTVGEKLAPVSPVRVEPKAPEPVAPPKAAEPPAPTPVPEPVKQPEPEPEPEPVKQPEPEPEPEPEPVKEEPVVEPLKPVPETPAKAAEPEPEEPKMTSPLIKKRKPPAQGDLLVVDGCGTTIVDDMVEYLDEDRVQFCLVQIPIGSGAFQRNKVITVQWAGERTPAMKKAKQVQKSGEVIEMFGSTHASITLTKYDEVDLEHIIKELKHVFVADNGQFSIGSLKEEIMARIAANKKQQEEKLAEAQKTMAALPKLRPSATDMGIDAEKALKEIRKPLGALNWALFEATTPLKLHEAGSDSVPEMQEHMDDSKVLYGIVRLGFGLGNFRRTKWVGVTFVGANIGAVQRGKLLSHKSEMLALLKPHQVTLEIQGSEMYTLEYVLEKVRPYIVADSIESSKKSSPSKANDFQSTLADFNKALLEEKAAAAEFFGEDPSATMASLAAIAPEYEDYDVKETIEKVKSANDPLLWAVFSLAHQ